MTDKRLQLALYLATLPMRKPILEFTARRFRVVSVQVLYDTDNDQGREILVTLAPQEDGAAIVVHEDGSVTEA